MRRIQTLRDATNLEATPGGAVRCRLPIHGFPTTLAPPQRSSKDSSCQSTSPAPLPNKVEVVRTASARSNIIPGDVLRPHLISNYTGFPQNVKHRSSRDASRSDGSLPFSTSECAVVAHSRPTLAGMTHQTTLRYSETLLRRSVFAFWRRTVGLGFLVALVFVGGGLAQLLYIGDTSWIVGALAVALVVGVSFIVAIYVVHFRNAMQKFRDMGTPEALLVVEDKAFTLTSGIGSTSLAWSSIAEVWCFTDFWLLLFSKAQFSTIPLANVSPEMQTFVLQRVRSAGGKIVS
jgi:hypothetical protein